MRRCRSARCFPRLRTCPAGGTFPFRSWVAGPDGAARHSAAMDARRRGLRAGAFHRSDTAIASSQMLAAQVPHDRSPVGDLLLEMRRNLLRTHDLDFEDVLFEG